MIRVAAVDYLNTKPLIYGFEQGMMADNMSLVVDYPAKIASMLMNDEVDLGLVPVAVIPLLKESYIISDYCIGCNGEVASVCLFSEVPLSEIENVILDYQSRTSVALFSVLLSEYWKLAPQLIGGSKGFEEQINGTTAGLVIGDRALKQRKRSKYIYDLGTAWKEMTGLPFVFAAWIANKKLPEDFITSFNNAAGEGFYHIDEIVAANPFPDYSLKEYYLKNIDYRLNEEKREALDKFLTYLKSPALSASKL